MNSYKITINGVTKELPLCEVNEHLDIAAFVIFGDVEMTVKSAEALLEKAPEFDYIITAEAKGIPLGYEMSRQSGKKYFVARKATKLYMKEVFEVDVRSITTARDQHLYLDKAEADEMKGKRVLIVDDVISTGESLRAVEILCEKAGANIVGKLAILAEGEAADRDDLVYLDKLPVFPK
ncbi:MAG: adenine phosphoribosyltransferase [Clostridia bacterium]|nr:adenine phosphoribosyltransferase [Clostridia bacterium]